MEHKPETTSDIEEDFGLISISAPDEYSVHQIDLRYSCKVKKTVQVLAGQSFFAR
jgi:hypothetical protein